jgi:hypothetical protein
LVNIICFPQKARSFPQNQSADTLDAPGAREKPGPRFLKLFLALTPPRNCDRLLQFIYRKGWGRGREAVRNWLRSGGEWAENARERLIDGTNLVYVGNKGVSVK